MLASGSESGVSGMRRGSWVGQTLVEYVLIVAVVSVAAMGILRAFSQSVQQTTDQTVSALSGAYNHN